MAELSWKDALRNPVRLSADRFTPLKRTPWAGDAIGRLYKDDVIPEAKGQRIGEAWEFSCDPEFPSFVRGTSLRLLDLVAEHPEAILSPERARAGATTCEILVKLLNASKPLSLQVHPRDGDPGLKPGECGKPESWLILHAEPGAGLYLGFAEPVTREALREALVEGERARSLLQFVPVKAGDFFEIEPGVPHAIGPGVTLLEPQRILSGQSGKTYRMWDWGRCYNEQGLEDPAGGKPRELHVDQSLKLVDPERQVGMAFVDTTRREAKLEQAPGGATLRIFPANPYYQVIMVSLAQHQTARLDIENGYGVMIPLAGEVNLEGEGKHRLAVRKGEPCLLPHAALPLVCDAARPSEFALIVPSGATVAWR